MAADAGRIDHQNPPSRPLASLPAPQIVNPANPPHCLRRSGFTPTLPALCCRENRGKTHLHYTAQVGGHPASAPAPLTPPPRPPIRPLSGVSLPVWPDSFLPIRLALPPTWPAGSAKETQAQPLAGLPLQVGTR